MKHQIEVEIRGRIKDFDKTLKEFKDKAKFIGEKDRFSLIYFRHELCKDVKEIKDEKVDLRLRVTNKKAEMIMKYGQWAGSDSRKEISIPILLERFDDAVEFLTCLDWNKGAIMATKTFVFNYKTTEFALVKNDSFNYFEAEKMSNEDNKEKVMREIKEVCKEFNLEPFDEDDFINQVNAINNKKENQFDFSKQKFSDIQERFKEFFLK